MWISLGITVIRNAAQKQALIFTPVLILLLGGHFQGQSPKPEGMPRRVRPELVLLIDINHDQEKVFRVEQSLALEVVHKLAENGSLFSVITFRSGGPSEIKSEVPADEALAAIKDLILEVSRKENTAPPKLYEALIVAESAFSHDASGRAVLVISGGREDLDGKRFKHIRSAFITQQIACHVAIVSSHPLYGTKGIQVRGFYLHDLARETRGKYVELGTNEKKVQPAVQKLTEQILQQEQAHVR